MTVVAAMQEGTVLILVRDILGAGLFAALAEGADRTPVFPLPGERPEISVERTRPACILVECYHPAARSDPFFGCAKTIGSRVIMFAPAAPWQDCEEIAHRRAVTTFLHPAPGQSLADLVRRALAD
jgi:hypothetical protein